MNRAALVEQIKKKSSYLCVGLDTDLTKIPSHLLKHVDPIFEFNKYIIDATIDYAVSYKPNLAFYECYGQKGWESLQKTMEWMPKEAFSIADAKRGDIGNTATMYAKAFFDTYQFDSVTVAPYMGKDSVTPFLAFDNKWAIVLGLTSNEGSNDFQQQKLANGKFVYEQVIETCAQWGSAEQLMFVVGATKAAYVAEIRKIIPDHFLLVPGVGAQGGSLEEISKYGLNKDAGLLINSSRGIIYADSSEHFAQAAKAEAKKLQVEMEKLMQLYC